MDLLRAWIDESYRAVAPKKLVATLPGPPAPPATKARPKNAAAREEEGAASDGAEGARLRQRRRRARPARRRALTVSELTDRIQGVLETEFFDVWVEGEVSNLKLAASGHWYFSLKDDQRAGPRGGLEDGDAAHQVQAEGRDEGAGARGAPRLPAARASTRSRSRCWSRSARARCSRPSRS